MLSVSGQSGVDLVSAKLQSTLLKAQKKFVSSNPASYSKKLLRELKKKQHKLKRRFPFFKSPVTSKRNIAGNSSKSAIPYRLLEDEDNSWFQETSFDNWKLSGHIVFEEIDPTNTFIEQIKSKYEVLNSITSSSNLGNGVKQGLSAKKIKTQGKMKDLCGDPETTTANNEKTPSSSCSNSSQSPKLMTCSPNPNGNSNNSCLLKYLSTSPTPASIAVASNNTKQVSLKSPSPNGKIPQLPQPKHVLYPRELIQTGWRQKHPVGCGFMNLGNSCYMNATLQALFHVPSFVNWLLNDEKHRSKCNGNHAIFQQCLVCAMYNTLKESSNRQNQSLRPLQIHNKLKMICKHFTHGRQEDAHEFLRYLLESMERSYLTAVGALKIDNRSKETTPLGQLFGGYLRTEVTCLQCNNISTTFQPLAELQLDIRHVTSLDDAVSNHFRRERLDNNDYKCEKCRTLSVVTKQFSLEVPPIVLCLQLKRFTLFGFKITKPIHCNRSLNLTKFLHKSRQGSYPDLKYRLTSLITHIGSSPNCGHYTAIAEASNSNLYQFDDSYVRPVPQQMATNSDAYVIIYELDTGSFEKSTSCISGNNNLTSNNPSVKVWQGNGHPSTLKLAQSTIIDSNPPMKVWNGTQSTLSLVQSAMNSNSNPPVKALNGAQSKVALLQSSIDTNPAVKAWNGTQSALAKSIDANRKRESEKTKEELDDEEFDSGNSKKRRKDEFSKSRSRSPGGEQLNGVIRNSLNGVANQTGSSSSNIANKFQSYEDRRRIVNKMTIPSTGSPDPSRMYGKWNIQNGNGFVKPQSALAQSIDANHKRGSEKTKEEIDKEVDSGNSEKRRKDEFSISISRSPVGEQNGVVSNSLNGVANQASSSSSNNVKNFQSPDPSGINGKSNHQNGSGFGNRSSSFNNGDGDVRRDYVEKTDHYVNSVEGRGGSFSNNRGSFQKYHSTPNFHKGNSYFDRSRGGYQGQGYVKNSYGSDSRRGGNNNNNGNGRWNNNNNRYRNGNYFNRGGNRRY